MSVRVGCPFCNHKVTLPAVPPNGRADCDRCGEAFAVSGAVEQVADPTPNEPSGQLQSKSITRLWPVVAAALLLGSAALLTGLAVRGRPADPPPAAVKPPTGPITWPPLAVPLLALLPADTGLAFAVQPGPLLAHAGRAGEDPQKLLAGLGVPDRVFATLADAGLPLDRIDLLAGGLVLPADSAIPRAVVAVRPKPPATVAGVIEKLKATRAGEAYKAVVGGLPVSLADRDGVLLLATWDAGLSQPKRPPGGGHLPAGLRDALGQLSPSAFAWAAADAADWADKPAVKAAALILKRPELLDRLKLARSAAVGLSLEPELRATAAVKAAGDEAALRDKLAAAVAGEEVLVRGSDGWVTLTSKPGELIPRN